MATVHGFDVNSTTIAKAWNVKRSDFLTRELRTTNNQIQNYINDLITDGYSLVDAPANGTINLTALSNSAHKYLVVWQTNSPTNTLNVTLSETMTDTGGSIITNNGHVIILGVKLNAEYVVTDYDLSLTIVFDTAGDYGHILLLKNVNYFSSGTLSAVKLDWINSTINANDHTVGGAVSNWQIDNTIIHASGVFSFTYTESLTMNNNRYEVDQRLDHTVDTTHILTFTNCIFSPEIVIGDLNSDYRFIDGGTGTNYINFNNSLVENMILVCTSQTNEGSIIYYNNITPSFNSSSNYNIKSSNNNRHTFLPKDVTEWTIPIIDIINNANYSSVDVRKTTVLENIRVAGNEFNRRYYVLDFGRMVNVDRSMKTMFAQEQALFVIKRDDINTDLVTTGKVVNNLSLYDSDGTTLFDYRNNENFFLVLQDSDDNYSVVGWWGGLLYPTVFADYYDNREYAIITAFQILEPPANNSWRNAPTDGDYDNYNANIEHSNQYQDMTSIFIDRNA